MRYNSTEKDDTILITFEMLRLKAPYWKSGKSCEIKLPVILISNTISSSSKGAAEEAAPGETKNHRQSSTKSYIMDDVWHN